MRKININVRRLAAFLTQKALEQQLQLDGIHRGDAQAIADGAVGRRAAPLAENPLATREAHDVPHNQEVAREAELGDQRELVRELLVVARGTSPPPALLRAILHQAREILVLAHPRRQRKAREPRLQCIKAKPTTLGDAHAFGESLLPPAPPLDELRVPFEIPLTIGSELSAHLVERRTVTERSEHVVAEPPLRESVVHVVGHDPRKGERLGEWNQSRNERTLLGQRVIPAFNGHALRKHLRELAGRIAREALALEHGQCRGTPLPRRAHAASTKCEELGNPPTRAASESEESASMRGELVERYARFAAWMIQPRTRDERAKIPPPLARLGEQHDVRTQSRHAVLAYHAARDCVIVALEALDDGRERDIHREFRAVNPGETRFLGGGRKTDRAPDVVVVGESEGLQAECDGALHQTLRVGGTIEQREGGMAVELGVARRRRRRGQSYHPCRCQPPRSR